MKKNILIIIPTILIVSAAFLFWKIKDQIDSDIKNINGMLYELDIEMDILEYTKNQYNDDKLLEEKILHLVISKLLILSHTNPPIEKLRGTPLNALNRLIVFNKSYPINFKLGGSDYVSQTIENYLNRIENEITIEISKRDKILRDPLKKEVKERWGISKETD
jgi:hypothetical protein